MPRTVGSYAIPRMDLGVAMLEFSFASITRIGMNILPIFKTPKKGAAFSKITRESLLRSRVVKRAPRGTYSRDDYEDKDQTYYCHERGHEQVLDDSEREVYASDFIAELQASSLAMNIVLNEQEKDVAAMIQNTAVWTGAPLFTDNKATPWSTVGTDIIGQVQAGANKVRSNCGMKPNALIIGYGALLNIRKNTAIRDAIKYTTLPTVDAILNALAGLFDVQRILVGDAVQNSAKEGQSFVGADVWSNRYATLARIAMTENLAEPCLGRTMLWVQDSPEAAMVEEYRENQTRGDVYRSRHNADEVVFDPNFAHLMQIEV